MLHQAARETGHVFTVSYFDASAGLEEPELLLV